MAKSKIEWTEVTWNPVTGCSKVSPGCKNCYAETIAKRFWGDRKFTDVICHEDRLEQPLHWKKPRMIFVNSMSDLFHEMVDFKFIREVYFRMALTPQHTYQVLTKRIARANHFYTHLMEYCEEYDCGSHINKWHKEGMKNVWLGVSVENQEQADKRIPLLLQTPAAVRWISAEPLLEEISISRYLIGGDVTKYFNLNWVVVGGESGQNKRQFDCAWARKLHFECNYALVPFFMKQVDKVQPIPEDLMIREYPVSK